MKIIASVLPASGFFVVLAVAHPLGEVEQRVQLAVEKSGIARKSRWSRVCAARRVAREAVRS